MIEDSDIVLLSVADGVATITFNRPERQNAWTPTMTERYVAALDACGRDPAVRAIVVMGAGGHWCVGGDGTVIEAIADGGAGVDARERPEPYRAMIVAKPVIAAISGVCFGIGLFHALCCDIRFASEDAKFSTAYARRGLPAEAGTSWLLQRAIGRGQAADLLYSARVVRADEALRIGLISRVVASQSVLDEALDYARTIAALCSPAALRMMKQQLHDDAPGAFADAFGRAETLLATASASDDFREGVSSWRERRTPRFAPVEGAAGVIATARDIGVAMDARQGWLPDA